LYINVTVGQDVHQGQAIGAAGSSGRVTAPHLHYEVRVAGVPRVPSLYLSSQPARTLARAHRKSAADEAKRWPFGTAALKGLNSEKIPYRSAVLRDQQ
jgi:murein DD-endopeptidase MepM/ murein hydrolase activator NlpD